MESLSSRNPRVQQLRRLVRQRTVRAEAGLFVTEGAGLLAEALAVGVEPVSVFVADGYQLPEAIASSLAEASVPVWVLDPSLLTSIASTSTPQPVLATLPIIEHSLEAAVDHDTTFAVVAAGISEPGNAGTLIRTAAAAGAQAVCLCDGSVDLFNPKVVRATSGALFRIPVVADAALGELAETFSRFGVATVGLAGAASDPYDELDFAARTALVFGNEAHGLSPDALAMVDHQVSIPMAAGVESVNVSAAAAAVCFEVSRQRRRAGRARP